MPTYEYECLACEATFERFQPMSAPPVRTCPECGKRRARRKISGGGGLLFKGSGFYINDYRKPEPSAKTDAEPAKPAVQADKPAVQAAKPAAETKPSGDPKPSVDAKKGGGKEKLSA